jgi:hypothetical protein
MVHESHPTFACPHCGNVYPFRPVLVDKAVRCTKCTMPFRVRADRTVEKVADSAPAPQPEISRTDRLVRAQAAGTTPRGSTTRLTKAAPGASAASPPSAALTPVDKSAAKTPTKPAEPAKPASDAAKPTDAAKPAIEHAPTDDAAKGGSARFQAEGKRAAAKAMKDQQEEMRRRMSASLNTVASKLAKDDPPPTPAAEVTEAVSGGSGRHTAGAAPSTSGTGRHRTAGAGTAARARAARKGDGEGKPSAQVVLTNEGDRLAREERQWKLGAAVVVMVPLLLMLAWWCWPNAKGDALRHFAAAPEGNGALHHWPEMVKKRGWMVMEQLPLVDAGSVSFTGGSSMPVANIGDVLGRLHGLAYDQEHGFWSAPGHQDAINLAWSRGGDRAAQLAAVTAAVGAVIEPATITHDLEGKGLAHEAAAIITRLSTGVAGGEEPHPLLDDLIAHPPATLETATFTGQGTYVTTGLRVERKDVSYHGTLLRMTGAGWPSQWQVWEVKAN